MKYPPAFNTWWNENKNSESLRESYQNYRQDTLYTDEKPMTFKQWALGVFQED